MGLRSRKVLTCGPRWLNVGNGNGLSRSHRLVPNLRSFRTSAPKRILYGVKGQGRGHASRSWPTTERLALGNFVRVFAGAGAVGQMSDKLKVSPLRESISLDAFSTPRIRYKNGKNKMAFFRSALDYAIFQLRLRTSGELDRLRGKVREFNPDLVISDFEPTLPLIAAEMGVPCLTFDHQHFLVVNDLSGLPFHLRTVANQIYRPLVERIFPIRNGCIVSSFYQPDLRPEYAHVTQVGPILRGEILESTPAKGEHLLVYMETDPPTPLMRGLLQLELPVRFYGLGQRTPLGKNVVFLEDHNGGFARDLAAARAVISTAGNQLMGEAMYLGKPILALPKTSNFEQLINAHFVRTMGIGMTCPIRAADWMTLGVFMERLGEFRFDGVREELNGLPAAIRVIEKML